MFVFTTHSELRSFLKKQTGSVGLVPTMGALHKGHLSLVQKAAENNNWVLVSIFINPTQFNNANDLAKYPKNMAKDLELLTPYNKKLIVYTPNDSDLYPKAINAKKYDFGSLALHMEGAFRDNHFNGVATVIEALFRNLKPDRAYFGEKDFQQLQIIKKMVAITKLPVNIITCPIEREANGLAMSSRNTRLSPAEVDASALIYKTLQSVQRQFNYESRQAISEWVVNQFSTHPLFELDYFQISEVESLAPIKQKSPYKSCRAFIAVNIGDVRLIDNIDLN